MSILAYIATNKVLRAKIAGLEARLHQQEERTYLEKQKHLAATKQCQKMALELRMKEVRLNQVHNAAENLATQLEKSGQYAAGHREGTVAIERARALAHWRSIQ